MQIKGLFTEDRAASPVIGVILMVAITVILAAVVGSFVLNLGGSLQQSAPQATFSFDYEQKQDEGGSDALNITHDAGDTIEGENLNVSSTGAKNNDDADVSVGTDVFTGSVTSGTSVTVDNSTFKRDSDGKILTGAGGPDGELDLSGATVRVVYNSDNGENSATLSTWEAPDA